MAIVESLKLTARLGATQSSDGTVDRPVSLHRLWTAVWTNTRALQKLVTAVRTTRVVTTNLRKIVTLVREHEQDKLLQSIFKSYLITTLERLKKSICLSR